MKLITLPPRDLSDIPKTLRNLADAIEKGKYGEVHNLVTVTNYDDKIAVGLMGAAMDPTSRAYYLLGLGQRDLEK